ncbi:hypothetical protein [Myxococcus sp. AB025B]|uniref:hypothetical protein n=1 Tax=Myxococcus sp. AB025B TaxID=2562794 RepID=UPI001142CE0A|nr:hypothetical protein [Myxococcus sp. AB025B]
MSPDALELLVYQALRKHGLSRSLCMESARVVRSAADVAVEDGAKGGAALCSMKGRCHGSLAHCDDCGDVGLLCDMEGSCDLHRERWTEWVLERSEVARVARDEGHAAGRAEARKERQEELDKANAFVSEARRQAAQYDEALFKAGLTGVETLDKARVVEVLRKWLPPTHAAFDDLGLTLDAPAGGGK